MTPLTKPKSLPDAARFLKDGMTFDDLDRAAARVNQRVACPSCAAAKPPSFPHLH